MTDRIGIFIDGPNLYGGARRVIGDGRLDIPALCAWIADGRKIAEVAYWNAQLKQGVDATRYAGQQRFFADIVNRTPNARIGRADLKWRAGRWVEKGVDVGVALDLVVGAFQDRWDTGIVVSGDGDLAGAGRLIREMGKSLEVVCCPGSLSGLLAAECATAARMLDKSVLMSLLYRRE